MSKGNTDEKYIAGLIRKGGLEEASEDFTERVMHAVEKLPLPVVKPNGSVRKAWLFFMLGTALVVPAVMLLGWLLSLYKTWLPELKAEHIQYFSYAVLLLFSMFVLYQFDLLLKLRFGR